MDDVNPQVCGSCHGQLSAKPLPCVKCKTSDICNNCVKKQKGQCQKCWNEIGKFTQKEQGECDICSEESNITPAPCNNCKIGSNRICSTCLKTVKRCPFCNQNDTFEKKLMDEILK